MFGWFKKKESVIVNCHIECRDGETPIMFHKGGTCTLNLVGYAVIPLEKYDALRNNQKRKRAAKKVNVTKEETNNG